MDESQRLEIKPQEGPQTEFLSCPADIVFYGGQAGGGKSFGLLLEPLRHIQNSDFGGVIFRRTTKQVRNEGGLWDESAKLYSIIPGSDPKESTLEWNFGSGARMGFSHLEHESSVYDWQGAQIAFIGFDEITHFSESQFFYMLSRNRSTCGVRPYVRGTCNPDFDSWVRKFIDWWIGKDGFAIPERSGVIRWFVRLNDKIHWRDSEADIYKDFGSGPEIKPKSFTFILAKLEDNKILMEKNPEYLANLLALPRIERERLRGGNWNIRASAGNFFQRSWFKVVPAMPAGVVQIGRGWDKAATKPSETSPDPDWTRGVKMAKLIDGRYVVMDVTSIRDTPGQVKQLVLNTASQDGGETFVTVPEDPGAAGKADAEDDIKMLAGYDVRRKRPSKKKALRAAPYSAQCEVGNVLLLKGPWNEDYLSELENFDGEETNHDDQVDASSDVFDELSTGLTSFDVN